MQVVKDNSAFDRPREKIKSYFSRGNLFYSTDLHLCFVCGANGDTVGNGESSLRSQFLAYISSLPDSKILCVRAETAATELLRQLEERKGANISLFEKIIAETVNSVLIFPESPGSFAELGYFSAHENIAEKTLVALKESYQTSSFITLGPIHLIARISSFAPVPITLAPDPTATFPTIVERLLGESLRKRPYRTRFSHAQWKELNCRDQLSILDEIIDLAGALTEADLLKIVSEIFGAYNVSTLRLLLSMLVATSRIARNDDGDIFSTRRDRRFIEDRTGERTTVIASWAEAYRTHLPEALDELEGYRK